MKYICLAATIFALACFVVSCHQVTYRRNELNAIDSIKAIKLAQQTYKNTKGKYGTLKELAEAGLIKAALSDGHYSGYRYDIRVASNSYAALATPEEYGKTIGSSTGGISLFIDETGIIRHGFKQGKEATVNDEPLPNQ